jgi:hypothetical protein
VRLILTLLCAISLSCAGMVGMASLDLAHAADDMPLIPKAWLDKKITIAEAEAEHPGINDERVQRFPDAAKPFGFKSGQWEAIKAAMQPGDELWTFASPAKSWEDLAGRAGIAVVRDGNPVMVLTTMLN